MVKSENAGRTLGLLVAALFSFLPSVDAGLCALCKKALEESGNAGLIHGFYWSILLIGGVPLVLMATGVYIIRRAEKNRR